LWAAPGMRDGVTIAECEKIIKQKRYMMMNVMEAYQIFKEQNSDIKIGKSKFFLNSTKTCTADGRHSTQRLHM
jgi:hypothetical protein